MPDERTPLITTVAVGPPVRRYPHQTLRRFCTVALGSSLVALLVVFLVLVVFDPTVPHRGRHHHHHHHGHSPGVDDQDITFKEFQRTLPEASSRSERTGGWNRYHAPNATDYAAALDDYVKSIEGRLTSLEKAPPAARTTSGGGARAAAVAEVKGDIGDLEASLARLHESVEQLRSAAAELGARAEELATVS